MITAAALLAAIKAHPLEDTPRLEYADLLDEEAGRATKRAALIRVQCELYGMKPTLWQRGHLLTIDPSGKTVLYTGDSLEGPRGVARRDGPRNPRFWELSKQEADLLAAADWLPERAHAVSATSIEQLPDKATVCYRRGFAWHVSAYWKDWCAAGDALCAEWVPAVRVLDDPDTRNWPTRQISQVPAVFEYEIAGRTITWGERYYMHLGRSAPYPVGLEIGLEKRWPGTRFGVRRNPYTKRAA